MSASPRGSCGAVERLPPLVETYAFPPANVGQGVATAADWGRAIMFSPAASLGGFQLCSRVPDSEWCSPVDIAGLKVRSTVHPIPAIPRPIVKDGDGGMRLAETQSGPWGTKQESYVSLGDVEYPSFGGDGASDT